MKGLENMWFLYLITSECFILVLHSIQVFLVLGIDVLITITINGVLVSLVMRQKVSSIAALRHATRNHLLRYELAIIHPSHLREQINDNSIEIVVTDVAKFTATVVIGEYVMVVVITKAK